MVDRGFKFAEGTTDHRVVSASRTPRDDEPSRSPPLRSPSRPPFGEDHRGRLLRGPAGRRRGACARADAARKTHDETVDDLHVCGSCASTLVYPTEWEEAGATHWEVTLRCPNCEWAGTGTFEQDLVERFDEELDRGTEALVRDLKRLAHANMEDEIERFTTALTEDHIVPEDF